MRNILLCVAGMTPQIITETLWALTVQRSETIDEVRVITTLGGRDKLLNVLLDKQHGKFYELCRECEIDPARIKFDETTIALLRTPDGRTLEDIRTVEENEHAGNQICEFVRELTKDPHTRIHASAAGGRKTMSIYLTAAMQLFGRAQDALSHVLISEDFEGHRDFFYPTREPRELTTRDGRTINTVDAEIYLADIQFIRLRGVGAEWRMLDERRAYRDMVRQAQTDLDILESEDEVVIDLRASRLNVRGRKIHLTRRELFFYLMFAVMRQQQEEAQARHAAQTSATRAATDDAPGIQLDRLRRADFEPILRRLTKARGDEFGLEECASVGGFEFISNMLIDLESHSVLDHDNFKKKFHETASRIKAKLAEVNLPEDYAITLRGGRGSSAYWLPVAPHRIRIVGEE